jgi:AraC-like DNA-binding protein
LTGPLAAFSLERNGSAQNGMQGTLMAAVDRKGPLEMPRPTLRYRVMYRRNGITLGDWHCIPQQSGPGPVEATAENAIVFVRQGVFRRHQGRAFTIAEPGAVLFFNRDYGYTASHPSCSGDRCSVITVTDLALCNALASMAMEAPPSPGGVFRVEHGYVSSAVQLTVGRLLAAVRLGDPLMIDAYLVTLVTAALEVQRKGRPRTTQPGRSAPSAAVDRVKEIAATRFGQRLSLQVFSKETGYSPYHLLRLFRCSTGIPIHRYLNRLRLFHALDRLETSDGLSPLAFDLGFSSHSHFTNAFRAEFGITPDRFRAGLRTTQVSEFRRRLLSR